jgi:hypothetical protein
METRDGYSVGDRVRVRDDVSEDWRCGTVVSDRPLKVRPDGWDMALSWQYMEKATNEQTGMLGSGTGSAKVGGDSNNILLAIDGLRAELRAMSGNMQGELSAELDKLLAKQVENYRYELFVQIDALRADMGLRRCPRTGPALPPDDGARNGGGRSKKDEARAQPAQQLGPHEQEGSARVLQESASTEALLTPSQKKDIMLKDADGSPKEIPPKWQTEVAFGDVPTEEQPGGPSSLEEVVRSQKFDLLVTAVVVANILTLAWQIDYAGRYWPEEKPTGFKIAEVVFCIIYCVELAMRLAVFGLSYWCGPKINWFNIFDSSLVVLQVADLLYPVIVGSKKGVSSKATLCLRILRMARFARVSRILHLVPNFRMLVISIIFSLKSLMWVILLISISTLIFGTVLTQLYTDYLTDSAEAGEVPEMIYQTEKLKEYFSTLDRSMLVLYMIISDGIHWAEIAEPLEKCVGRPTILIFIAYSLLSVMAMMNVLTAFFVETAVKAGVEDKRANMINNMWTLFQGPAGPAGVINEEEFKEQMHDPRMAHFLKEMELDAEDMDGQHFFQILDRDDSGTVDLNELVAGCVRLTQTAKTIDVASLQYAINQEQGKQDQFRTQVMMLLNQRGASGT